MLLSCPGCHSIQYLAFFDINEKKKVLARHLQLSCTVCLYNHTFFTSKQIDLPKKTKKDKNFMMCMLELFVDVDKFVLVMSISKNFIVT